MKRIYIILFIQITLIFPSLSDMTPFQRSSIDENTSFMAMLINENFWEETGVDLSDPDLRDLKNFIDKNIMFMVIHWKTATIEPTRGESVGRNTSCKYNSQTLEQSSITSDLTEVLNLTKELFGSAMGELGRNIEFVNFKKPFDYGIKGILKLSYLNEHKLEWDIPLVEYLPNMIDPMTREAFQGDYKYNPYNGRKLVPSF